MKRIRRICGLVLLAGLTFGCGEESTRPREPGPMLHGTVISVNDDAPLAGVEIFVVEGTRWTVVAGPAVTDSAGSYRFADLPRGVFSVLAFDDAHLLFDRTSRRVALEPEGSVRHDLRMIRSELWDGSGYAVEGRVLDAESEQPIEGAFVSGFFGPIYHSFAGISIPSETITGPDGRFRVSHLVITTDQFGREAGILPIGATKEGYEAAFSSLIPLPEAPDTVAHYDFLLSREHATGSIEGRVVHEGEPMPGIRVGLDCYQPWNPGSRPAEDTASRTVPYLGKSTTTDSAGTYRFERLPHGLYSIQAAYLPDDGYVAPLRAEMQVTLGDSSAVVLHDISLARAIEAIAPPPRATIDETTPRLEWELPPDADRVRVSLGIGHILDSVYEGPARAELVLPDPLPPGGNVRWIVEAWREDVLVGRFEEVATFRIADRAPAPLP
ncbi:MAG: hypothetical protein GF346_05365 [Candidatus Eisenbacteria bacterium]|nr:hypothetical protein [Candidatus Latescibacterota bacterium]MBD3301856.1 hypothetical protein [Candidatus Eisenbacteria bacterium]